MQDRASLVVFRLDAQHYALPLSVVERVVHAVAVTPLPAAPAAVFGLINVEGTILPVFNLRRRFALPEREIRPADRFLIARTARRTVALAADEVSEVMERAAGDIVGAGELGAQTGQIRGVVRLEDGLVLIHDLEKFLSADEEASLDEALRSEASRGL